MLAALLLTARTAAAEGRVLVAASEELLELSLEELMHVKVTSAGKKSQELDTVPAAMTVITREDIRRSTATSLPGLLRQVPGLHVARMNGSSWMVTARGFSNIYPNKLLVLADGRPLYSSLFGGVLWPLHVMVLDNIERIEVIRGPAGATWGANAVNGVINIITRNAAETHGARAEVVHGSNESVATFRWGAPVSSKRGDEIHYRLSGKYTYRDGQELPSGHQADEWLEARVVSFRVDADMGSRNEFMATGLLEDGNSQTLITQPLTEAPYVVDTHQEQSGQNVYALGRWKHSFSEENELSLQLFYDRTNSFLRIPLPGEDATMYTRQTKVDLELNHIFSPWERHEVVWGIGARLDTMTTRTTRKDLRAYDPETRTQAVLSAFLQDEVELVDDAFWLTLGVKVESSEYMGVELSPSLKARWQVTPEHVLWASVARAVRAPSQVEHDSKRSLLFTIPPAPGGAPFPVSLYVAGSEDFKPEDVWAFEAGYRAHPWERVSMDMALFYNVYRDLSSVDASSARPGESPAVFLLPFENRAEGETWGMEASATVDILPQWRVTGAFTLWESQFRVSGADFPEAVRDSQWGLTPHHMFHLQSRLDLGENAELDLFLRSIDELDSPRVPGYTELNARLAWRPHEDLELALIGRNLLDDSHPEFSTDDLSAVGFGSAVEIERALLGRVSWTF